MEVARQGLRSWAAQSPLQRWLFFAVLSGIAIYVLNVMACLETFRRMRKDGLPVPGFRVALAVSDGVSAAVGGVPFVLIAFLFHQSHSQLLCFSTTWRRLSLALTYQLMLFLLTGNQLLILAFCWDRRQAIHNPIEYFKRASVGTRRRLLCMVAGSHALSALLVLLTVHQDVVWLPAPVEQTHASLSSLGDKPICLVRLSASFVWHTSAGTLSSLALLLCSVSLSGLIRQRARAARPTAQSAAEAQRQTGAARRVAAWQQTADPSVQARLEQERIGALVVLAESWVSVAVAVEQLGTASLERLGLISLPALAAANATAVVLQFSIAPFFHLASAKFRRYFFEGWDLRQVLWWLDGRARKVVSVALWYAAIPTLATLLWLLCGRFSSHRFSWAVGDLEVRSFVRASRPRRVLSRKFAAPALPVSVLCTEDFIRLTAIVGRGGFFGLLRTGQGEEGCSVEGVGEAELSLWVPLRSSSSCGARPEEGGFVSLVVEVIAVAGAESASDATFLVQCESGPPSEGQEDPAAPRPVPSPLIAASLAVLLDDRPVRSALVGELVTLELSLPSPDSYRVSSCLAFSRGPERLRFLPLMDRRGCPVADLISLFGPVYGTERLRAELRLFRFNHSHDLHVQCLLESCGGKCEAPTCRQEATQGLLGARLIRQNHPESLAAQRLSVMDPPPQLPSPAERQCNYAEESDLVGLLLLFVVLSISAAVLFLTAWLNRPAELGWPAFLRSRSSAASDHSHLLPPPPAKDTAHNHSAHAQGPVQEGFSLRRKPKPPSIFHRSMPRRIRRAESVTEETRKAGVLPGSYPAGSASASSTLRSTAGSDATVDAQPTRSSNASSSPRPLPPTPPPRLCSLPALPFPSPPQMAAEAGGQGRDVGGQEEASRSPSGMARSGTPACVERGSPSVHSHDADRSVRSFFYSVSATFQNTLARLRPFSALSDRI